jgi:glycosyltransferase involved in cell wall biosynthesis
MVADFYWPYLGGVEQHVRTLSHALQCRGHEVTVATQWGEGLPMTEEDQGVRVERLRGSTQRAKWLFSEPRRPWAPPFPDPEITAGLRRVIRRDRPEIVHGHDWLARSFLPLKPWSGAKSIMSLHYYTLACAKKNLMTGDAPCSGPGFGKCLRCASEHYGPVKGAATVVANWGMAAAERAMVDMFIAVSWATAAGNRLGHRHLPQEVIPNFVPDPSPVSRQSVESYLEQLPAEPFLMFVGDLRPIKGLAVLLEAYAGLRNAPPLVLIGKRWPDTPAALPTNTYVLYDWPNEAVRAAYERCLIGLVPSLWREPFGIVVIEAMAAGKPVVASRIGGIPEIITDGETGLLVSPGDAAALAAAMTRLIDNGDLRHVMGRAARRRAGDFSVSAVVPRIEAVYHRVLAS